jgi:hypothetical protein
VNDAPPLADENWRAGASLAPSRWARLAVIAENDLVVKAARDDLGMMLQLGALTPGRAAN